MGDGTDPHKPARTAWRMFMEKLALAVLVFGLAAAALIFALAPPETGEEPAGVYVASINNSKKYRLELQRIGGKAAVAAAEFSDWFDSLWQGRRLAGTLVVISVAGSLLCLGLARLPPLDD